MAKDTEESMLKKGRQILVASVAKPATQRSIEAYLKRETSSHAEQFPAALPMQETSASVRLQHLFRQLKSRQDEFPPGLVHALLEAISVLRCWQIIRHPTNAQRNAMTKIASKVWRVPA